MSVKVSPSVMEVMVPVRIENWRFEEEEENCIRKALIDQRKKRWRAVLVLVW